MKLFKKKINSTFPDAASSQQAAAGKRKKRKLSKRLIIIICIVLIAAAFVLKPVFFGSEKRPTMRNAIEHTVSRRDISVSVSGTATIEPSDSYNVTALVKGEILNAPFEEGQILEKGALLYKIQAKEVENSISQAEIALKNARLSYASAQDSINNLTLKSQSAGKISKIYFDPGDSVPAGAAVADIIDNSVMLLKLPFNSADAKRLSVGQSALVTVSSTGEQLTGSISAISPLETADKGGSVTSEVTISVKNPGGISEQTEATATAGNFACSSSGIFSYNTKKSVFASVSGEVSVIHKNEGDLISSGDTIISLKNDALSRQLESSALAITNSELSLKNLRDSLDNYQITSPISGTVIEKNFKTGDTIDATTASSSMAVIYDMSALKFKINIDELYISKISVGQKVSITADAVEGKTFSGYVDKVNINGVTSNGVTSYPVTVTIENSDGLLPGMNISAVIVTDSVSDVLSIPVSAVMRGNSVTVRRKSSSNGKESFSEESVSLSLGRSDGNYIEVIDGLSEGDIILIDTSTTSVMSQMMR